MYLHRLLVWDLLVHVQTDNIEQVGIYRAQGNACRVEFCTSAWVCWTDPDFHRSYRSMTAGRGVAWLYQVGCRNFLVDLGHHNLCPYSAISYQRNCTMMISKRQTRIRHCLTYQSRLQPCPNRHASSALESEDLMTSKPVALFPRSGSRPLVAPWPFYLFCSVA